MESLRFMMGGSLKKASSSETVTIRRTAEVTIETANSLPTKFNDDYGNEVQASSVSGSYKVINMTTGVRSQVSTNDSLVAAQGDVIRIFWEETKNGAANAEAVEIVISPSTFPGTLR